MNLPNAMLLFVAAALAGALNSVAGGGSFISFPALIFNGILPIPANATSTVALWPGSVASISAYRNKMPWGIRILVPLVAVSLVGGMLGALLLLRTPQDTFLHMVSYLFLAATLLFTFGNRISNRLQQMIQRSSHRSMGLIVTAALAQLLIAVYGGFFGGGIGILMLAVLSLLPVGDIHSMNAVKALLGTAINGVAVITFIVAGAVVWPQALLMIVGAVIGGYGGGHYAQKINPNLVRGLVIAVGFTMSFYFLWKY